MFESILVANRGEIAVRIIRAAREMAIRTIAVFSDADEGALWTRLADEAHRLGPAVASESYLSIPRLMEVAKAAGAAAVHPGYGLLSESAEFARAVEEAGLVFIGPEAPTIAMMGDKVEARRAAQSCGVPVLPGTDRPVGSLEEALALADHIGWPIAVKASFGGGGRGMRVATNPDQLGPALEQAAREAASAFGRAEVFLERFLMRPRHIEVQVLGDSHGNVIHLGDRDCSVQRRHQKLLEEAPAPALPPLLRARISDAAITLCRSVGYRGAGTVEFLADVADESFFFLEMNTRLQVEHGVTELVTGIDLVRQQILVATGAPLQIRQEDVVLRGHAIQGRIAAEDPWEGFRPTPGKVRSLKLPLGPWVRLDFGIEQGDSVPQFYDSMFGKVQAWGATRDEARARLALALDSLAVEGVSTTAPYLRTLIDRYAFVAASHDTGSLERDWLPDASGRPAKLEPLDETASRRSERSVGVPWGGRIVDVAVYGLAPASGGIPAASGQRPDRRASAVATGGGPLVTSPMDAVIISLGSAVGDRVAKGDPILLLEAMKMEVVIAAPHDGIVEAIHVAAGDTVKTGAKLVTVLQEARG
ncbi:MAG TPA: biotin carboxylase N-terminal domain-containing protein [Allosphingosinicella sp.]|jgi:acetyl-CoA/propionyl-CoA carboxylase biotin carboxyl carrier protein